MALLFNPWVISIIVLSILVGNIMALKYTANVSMPKNSQLDALIKADKHHHNKRQ